jgi:hypothetical protein
MVELGRGLQGNEMKLARRRFLQCTAGAAACLALARPASAQPKSYLSESDAAKLRAQIAAVAPDIRSEFARRFEAWRKTWDSPAIAPLSDSAAVRRSDEFAALIALGAPVLPLLIEKIAQPNEFFALQAFEAIKPDWPTTIECNGERVFKSEQAKARRAVKDWFAL